MSDKILAQIKCPQCKEVFLLEFAYSLGLITEKQRVERVLKVVAKK